jgi:hypothetical protein
MIVVKSILAGLAALAGAIIVFLLSALFVVPILAPVIAGIGITLNAAVFVLAAITAVVIFYLGFRWEYRGVKARQAN